jgi:RND superfamily putative drug exporter
MFRILGQMVRRGWPFRRAAWVLLLAGTWWAAPPWDQVARDREFAFLPEDAPSRVAEAVYAKAFPGDPLGSNVVLVLHRAGKEAAQRKRDLQFITDFLEPGLRNIAEAEGGLAFEIKPSAQFSRLPSWPP